MKNGFVVEDRRMHKRKIKTKLGHGIRSIEAQWLLFVLNSGLGFLVPCPELLEHDLPARNIVSRTIKAAIYFRILNE